MRPRLVITGEECSSEAESTSSAVERQPGNAGRKRKRQAERVSRDTKRATGLDSSQQQTSEEPLDAVQCRKEQVARGVVAAESVAHEEPKTCTESSQRRSSSATWPRGLLAFGVTGLVGVLIDAEVPVVFHNGFLDLLHLFHKFVQPLPTTLEDFKAEVRRLFTGGVYDTKFIANRCNPCNVFARYGPML